MYEPVVQQAITDAFRQYGLSLKLANMQMIRRMMHFEDLAQHANPMIRQTGQKLLANASKAVPQAIAPASIKPAAGMLQRALP
jgi:hypothetical protein